MIATPRNLVDVSTFGNRQLYSIRFNQLNVNTPISFTGNHVYVLNRYVPEPTLNILSDKQINFLNYLSAHENLNRSEHLVFQLRGGSAFHFPYERLYFSGGGLYNETVNSLNMRYDAGTVLDLLLSENEIMNPALYGNDHWEHRLFGTFGTAGQYDCTIGHGFMSEVSVTLELITVVNPVRFRLSQQGSLAEVAEIDIWPSVFPFMQTWIMPMHYAGFLRIIIDAGGAAETAVCTVKIVERRRP